MTALLEKKRGPLRFGEPTYALLDLYPRQGEWTESDYFALPDRRGYELNDGYLEQLPMPTEAHQLIGGELYASLRAFVKEHRLGIVSYSGLRVRLWPGQIREPDVVFLRREKYGSRTQKYWAGADLAIEIVSEGGEKRDRVEKLEAYAKARIEEYWIVDPESERIETMVLRGDTYERTGDLGRGDVLESVSLPGFSIAVDQVFDAAQEE